MLSLGDEMKHYRETDNEMFLKALNYLKDDLKFKPKIY